jgi:hypothetical protein
MQQEKEELVGSKLMAVFKECSPKARKRLVMLYRFICRKDNKLMIKTFIYTFILKITEMMSRICSLIIMDPLILKRYGRRRKDEVSGETD